MTFSIIIGIIAAIVATVYLCMKVLPAKFDGSFSNKWYQFAHDYFNFKKLYLESALKALFAFFTVTCVIIGVIRATVGNLLQFIVTLIRSLNYGYLGSWIWAQLFTNLLSGLAIAVLGPIVLRLAYEAVLMFILLVKNVIEINNKMKSNEQEKATPKENTEEVVTAEPQINTEE